MEIIEIKEKIEEVIEKYYKNLPIDNNIYYMNGNDGTDFDWDMNYRVCEFCVYKLNEERIIKMLINQNGSYTIYIYEYEEPYNGNCITVEGKIKLDPYKLACHLYGTFDERDIWDEPIKDWILTRSEPIINY